MKKPIIDPEKDYTFHDYFRMRASTEEILSYFGYTKINERLELPRSTDELKALGALYERLEEHLVHISLENELTRREFLIAPIMSEVRHLTRAKLNSEYWFEFNHQLKGSLDYLFRNDKNLIVVEAKQADLTRGFVQLSVEMIAVDKADETKTEKIYRNTKIIHQDVNLYVLLNNLEDILRILIGILEIK